LDTSFPAILDSRETAARSRGEDNDRRIELLEPPSPAKFFGSSIRPVIWLGARRVIFERRRISIQLRGSAGLAPASPERID
jgi:hypothetical protein